MFEKKFCKNCHEVQLFGFANYCRVCQENWQDYQALLNDKLNNNKTFKRYVEENILSKINAKKLEHDFYLKQQEWKYEEEQKMIQDHKTLREKIREINDPLPKIIP